MLINNCRDVPVERLYDGFDVFSQINHDLIG